MASLKKRGRYYYIKFSKTVDGKIVESVKSLRIRYKDKANQALEDLEKLEEAGNIDPFREGFNPRKILDELNSGRALEIYTVREAADYFYKKKSHLSNSTVKNAANRTMDNSGAYEQAIEHFIALNDIADLSPLLVKQHHFENVIFKPGIKPATRHFYFKQLRVWWNKLLDWEIVKHNHLAAIKKDLPEIRDNTRPKMLTRKELGILFTTFDKELNRKLRIKEYDETRTQRWFKPLIAVYFYCGLRKHEAAYKSDLEYSGLQGNNLYFENNKVEMIYLPATKGRKERSIPVPAPCQQLLHRYLEQRGPIGYQDYLFVYHGGRRRGYPVTGAQAYRVFKHYLEKANLPDSRTLHGMRHERITRWIEDGYSLKEAGVMAGHTSQSVTQGYTHLAGRHLLKKMRVIEQQKNGRF